MITKADATKAGPQVQRMSVTLDDGKTCEAVIVWQCGLPHDHSKDLQGMLDLLKRIPTGEPGTSKRGSRSRKEKAAKA